ncbi:MAG UNVERIFIED_CONTAM: hypothetical protein LVT10_24495 [Anaerolineae bacterium]|jgi:predicted RNA binding protein YcfA (HicA-like mRNA interferase family)
MERFKVIQVGYDLTSKLSAYRAIEELEREGWVRVPDCGSYSNRLYAKSAETFIILIHHEQDEEMPEFCLATE